MGESKSAAAKFLRANFAMCDRLAIIAFNKQTGHMRVRTSSVAEITQESYQRWLYFLNGTEKREISACLNPIKDGEIRRVKDNIAEVRHIHLDIDEYGEYKLEAIKSNLYVPNPNIEITTSPDHYQVVWKVQDMDRNEAEALMRGLVREFGSDRAATDVTRGIRLPGFVNNKYHDRPHVTCIQHSIQPYDLAHFPTIERIDPYSHETQPRPATIPHQNSAQRPANGRSAVVDAGVDGGQSSVDWARTKRALALGEKTPEEMRRELIITRGPGTAKPKPNPEYYARVTVTKAIKALESQGQWPPRQHSHERSR